MAEPEAHDERTHLNPPGFCVVPGCSGESVTTRVLPLGGGEEREVEVCWKHAEGDLDLDWLSPFGN
jgi:hypothetical protein